MWSENGGLTEQLVRLMSLMHRYRHQAGRTQGPLGDPHRGQGRVLSILTIKPELSQKELSYLLDIRGQSLGELLAKLEKAGYVTRAPSEQDRRVMMVRLSEKGKKAAETLQQDNGGDLFDCLDDVEKGNFSQLLDKLIHSLEEKLGVDPNEQGRGREFFGHGPDGDFGGFEGFLSRMRGGPFEHGHSGRPEPPPPPPRPHGSKKTKE